MESVSSISWFNKALACGDSDLSSCCLAFGLISSSTEGPDKPEAILIDEVLTPDSSRYWPADQYAPGRDQPSYDKQYVRNYLQHIADTQGWNKQPPGPALPDEVIRNTRAKYLDAYRLLTGHDLQL